MTLRQIIDKVSAYRSLSIADESQQRLILNYLNKIPVNREKWELRSLFAKLIKELPCECLPQYLTHDDEYIRKKALERIDRSD